MAYQAKVIKRTGMTLEPSCAIKDYWAGAVVWKGEKDETCHETGWFPMTDKGKALALKAAERLKKRYEDYRQRTGKRFEVLQREKREKETAIKRAARDLRRRQEVAAPKLIDAVEYLIAEIDGFKIDNEFISRRSEAVKAILKEIETAPAKEVK